MTDIKTCPICGEEFEGNDDFCKDCALADSVDSFYDVRDSDYGN